MFEIEEFNTLNVHHQSFLCTAPTVRITHRMKKLHNALYNLFSWCCLPFLFVPFMLSDTFSFQGCGQKDFCQFEVFKVRLKKIIFYNFSLQAHFVCSFMVLILCSDTLYLIFLSCRYPMCRKKLSILIWCMISILFAPLRWRSLNRNPCRKSLVHSCASCQTY